MENRWFVWGSLLALASGVAMCFWALHGGGNIPRESILLSLFLTLLSVAASWIASRYYADYPFNKNLRTFALKAAEKVNNLALELDRLPATATNIVTLDAMPGAPAVETNCVRCGSRFRALRTGSGVGVKPVTTAALSPPAPLTLTENLLERVRGRMPAQPRNPLHDPPLPPRWKRRPPSCVRGDLEPAFRLVQGAVSPTSAGVPKRGEDGK